MSIKPILFIIFISISFINSIRLIDNDFFEPEIKKLIRKIYRLSISKDNEVFMNILIERLRKYILNHELDEERPEAPRENYKNIGYIKGNFTVDEDGTYDMITHEIIEFDRGYQVSFEREHDDYSSEEYDYLAYKMSIMSDNHAYLGVYGALPELSFNFDDLELAKVIGILFNQISIWDWSRKEEIINEYVKEYS